MTQQKQRSRGRVFEVVSEIAIVLVIAAVTVSGIWSLNGLPVIAV